MLRELLLSVASGVIVALILQMFRFGRARSAPAPRQSMRYYEAPPRRRGSFFGGLLRFVFSVAGGIALAYAVAPFIFGRRFRDYDDYGDYGRYDRFDGFGGLEGILNHTPMLILTVVATIIVWAFLSALTRR